MYREVLSRFDMPWLSILGLFIFLAFFIGVLLWVSLRANREIYARLEKLPLQEDMTS